MRMLKNSEKSQSGIKDNKSEQQDHNIETEEKIKKLIESLEVAKNDILREKAENENLRKRFKLELENAYSYSIAKFAQEIVTSLEDIHRAIETVNGSENELSAVEKQIIKGIELTRDNLTKTLAKFDIHRVYPLKAEFDAELHEAISQIPNDDVPQNTIIDVIQAGYRLRDRVLKPAQVVVSRKS